MQNWISLGSGWRLRHSSGSLQRIEKLVAEGVGEFFFDAVSGGPFFGEVMRAEDSVEPGEGGGIVAVDGAGKCVVPMVEGGSGNEPLEGAEAPAEIGMDEKAPGGGDQGRQNRHEIAGGDFGAA